ncbi:MAG: hypothetical protein ABR991_08410 [Terracidiphilus sp.]
MQLPTAIRTSSDSGSPTIDIDSLGWGDRSSSPEWESAPSPSPASFAGILEALAAPEQPSKKLEWNDDDLADDVATLSYEDALKTHARYHATDQSLTQPANVEPFSYEEACSDASAAAPHLTAQPIPSRDPRATANQEFSLNRTSSYERNLKDASITIRMSKAECAQLHQRADEAGLTVSAYLRSCTFEAESLRAMVKDTLAQLRSATAPVTPTEPRRSWFHGLANWVARLLTPWHGSPRVARA